MGFPYTPEITVNGQDYFPEPYSIIPLPEGLKHGLIPVGVLAVISVLSTVSLISFILYRLFFWQHHYRTFLGYNQYVILVLNLLLADLQQSAAFVISFHWLHKNAILAPHPACFAQGWLLHSGDVGSGLFVFAIAAHTFYTAVYGRRVGNKPFALGIIGIWIFAYFLTGVGVGVYGQQYFVRAGAWCWISSEYEELRLALHYLWIFMIEFGTIVIYVIIFFALRKKTKSLFAGERQGSNAPNMATVQAVNRITKLMVLYPFVYLLLTLPLSAGRMWSMAHGGQSISNAYACAAGAMMTSSGWVDSLLYTLTRKKLLQDSMPGQNATGRRTADAEDWEAAELGSKGITHTRTVTVEGGQMLDTFDEAPSPSRSNTERHNRNNSVGFRDDKNRSPSPSGSVDPIWPGRTGSPKFSRNRSQVSAGVQEILSENEAEKEDQLASLSHHYTRQGYRKDS